MYDVPDKRVQNDACINSTEREEQVTKAQPNGNVPALRFPEFCGEWNTSSIGEQFELYSGNTPSRIDKKQFEGTVNWITSGELKEHYIADTKEKISDEAVKSNNLKLLPVGTFVIEYMDLKQMVYEELALSRRVNLQLVKHVWLLYQRKILQMNSFMLGIKSMAMSSELDMHRVLNNKILVMILLRNSIYHTHILKNRKN